MKLLVSGGRKFNKISILLKEIKCLIKSGYQITEIVHGDALGADTVAKKVALHLGIKHTPFPADWSNLDVEGCIVKTTKGGKKYNSLAGTNRNREMSEYIGDDGVLLAVWNGKSTGTKHMIDTIRYTGREVITIRYIGE
jgi:hypothetical protein